MFKINACLSINLTISAYKWCSIRLCLRLFVGLLISYLRYLCLFTHSGVQHILCCVFALFVFVFCVLCFSGLSIFDCPFGILWHLFNRYVMYSLKLYNSLKWELYGYIAILLPLTWKLFSHQTILIVCNELEQTMLFLSTQYILANTIAIAQMNSYLFNQVTC